MKTPTEPVMPRMLIASRDKAGREIALNKERIAIGRAPKNEIVIDDPAISGEHAVITIYNGDVLLEDLDSTNGTKINGQPVKMHFLQDGDLIELGRYTIRYKYSAR
jgi:pSer/pThr/pTyr-binding forkhead associated (FHA) protein